MSDRNFSDEEAQRRFEQAVKAGLRTPPQPLKDRPLSRPESKRKAKSSS